MLHPLLAIWQEFHHKLLLYHALQEHIHWHNTPIAWIAQLAKNVQQPMLLLLIVLQDHMNTPLDPQLHVQTQYQMDINI